jgi:hypothetical protein
LGAAAIGTSFAKLVAQTGRRWTVDQILTDVDRGGAVLEWTQFDPPDDVLRASTGSCSNERRCS